LISMGNPMLFIADNSFSNPVTDNFNNFGIMPIINTQSEKMIPPKAI
jgi:hypothetical protein